MLFAGLTIRTSGPAPGERNRFEVAVADWKPSLTVTRRRAFELRGRDRRATRATSRLGPMKIPVKVLPPSAEYSTVASSGSLSASLACQRSVAFLPNDGVRGTETAGGCALRARVASVAPCLTIATPATFAAGITPASPRAGGDPSICTGPSIMATSATGVPPESSPISRYSELEAGWGGDLTGSTALILVPPAPTEAVTFSDGTVARSARTGKGIAFVYLKSSRIRFQLRTEIQAFDAKLTVVWTGFVGFSSPAQ